MRERTTTRTLAERTIRSTSSAKRGDGIPALHRQEGSLAITRLSAALPLSLDRASSVPLYRQIEAQFRDAILDGRLRRGARLPPIRLLASELQVGRITAITAYEQLAAEGYVVGRVGSGTRVAEYLPEEALQATSNRSRLRLSRHFQDRWGAARAMTTRAKALIAGGGTGASVMYDFGRRPLAGGMLPAAVWERLYRRAWKHQMAVDAGPGGPNPAGDLLLRQAISEYLGVTRGIRCGPEDVVVASTTQALLCAAAELWLEPGRAVVVEDPSCPGGRQGLELQGPTIIPVPVDRDGIRTDALPPEATLAVVTPSCHFPTGATMSLSRRQELLDWGRATNSLIVELDIDSHYRYSGKSLPAIHALDSADRVLYIGDLGHVLVHGIGLAFAVVPESARDAMREILVVAGHNVPHVDQRAIALLLTEGYFDRHVRRIRIAHERMRDVMLEAIRSELRSWVTVDGPEVGARMTMRLVDSPLSAPQLAKEAYRQGVRVGQIWRVSGEPDEARLSLVFAGQSPVTIWRGIRRLRKILEAA